MGITLILCKESWRVLWTLFTQGGHEYRGSRQFLSFLISLAYPDQLRLNPPRPGCHRNQGRGIGQGDVSKKQPNVLRCDFLMDFLCACVHAQSLSYVWLCDHMEGILPGSCIHGILQARILEWVAIPFFRGTSQPRDQTWVSCIAGRFLTVWATMEVPNNRWGHPWVGSNHQPFC